MEGYGRWEEGGMERDSRPVFPPGTNETSVKCSHWELSVKKCAAILCPFHYGKDGCKMNGYLSKGERK